MQHDEPNTELPTLSDEDIKLLHVICKRASPSDEPPFKALFAAYDGVFKEEQIAPAHDGVIFRLLMRVGERVKKIWIQGSYYNYADVLRDILEAHGITVLDDDEEHQGDYNDDEPHYSSEGLPLVELAHGHDARKVANAKRRVSFNDAHLEQTTDSWDAESPPSIVAAVDGQGLLSRPPIRPHGAVDSRRHPKGRSSSLDLDSARSKLVLEKDEPHHAHALENNHRGWAHPVPQQHLTYEDLVDHAEAFLNTSTFHAARKYLRIWRKSASTLRTFQDRADIEATDHDYRTLLKQAVDVWHAKTVECKHDKAQHKLAENYYGAILMRRYLLDWQHSAASQRRAVAAAKIVLLKIRYFKRWRALAIAHAAKARLLLAQKMFHRWREVIFRRRDQVKVAELHLTRRRMETCFHAWFWQFCRNRVEGWHEDRLIHDTFTQLRLANAQAGERSMFAAGHYESLLQRSELGRLQRTVSARILKSKEADRHFQMGLLRGCLGRWSVATRLKRPEVKLKGLIKSNLQRYAFTLLQERYINIQQARQFDHQKLLRATWTKWNDALRSRALSHRVDERVVIEALYRWVLQERLVAFQRAREERVAQRVLSHFHALMTERQTQFDSSMAQFVQDKARHTKSFVIVKLNRVLNRREQGVRTATEYRNDRIIPRVLDPWVDAARQVLQQQTWAQDSQFYFCASRALRLWKTQTTDNQHRRKKIAYAQIRVRVKKRLAKTCLDRLRQAHALLASMTDAAAYRAQIRLSTICSNAFTVWTFRYASVQAASLRAAELDRQRLLTSGVTALTMQYSITQHSTSESDAFRQESDSAMLFSAFKKLQWHQFTASRRLENAEALSTRNRETHFRQMLRHWAGEAHTRRLSKTADVDPESPSLRPASRAASRLSAQAHPNQHSLDSSIATTTTTTPAYLRTPSRPRRAMRFRPLATPAPVTPFAFEQAYLATVPNPLLPSSSPYKPRASVSGRDAEMASLTPQITPFARKLRAGGVLATPAAVVTSGSVMGMTEMTEGMRTAGPGSLRRSVLGRNLIGSGSLGTGKSVRFANGRAGRMRS